MATRSQVRFIKGDKEVMLYHHWDGYIEGVGFDLVKRLKKHTYASDMLNKMVKECNYEITFGNHLDIEYFYIVDFDKKTVKGQSVDNWGKPMQVFNEYDCNALYDEKKDVELYQYEEL